MIMVFEDSLLAVVISKKRSNNTSIPVFHMYARMPDTRTDASWLDSRENYQSLSSSVWDVPLTDLAFCNQ